MFSSPYGSDRLLVPTQLPIQWVSVALSWGVKRQGREAVHSPRNVAEVKKTWIYTLIEVRMTLTGKLSRDSDTESSCYLAL
jgi:hypothetical protein